MERFHHLYIVIISALVFTIAQNTCGQSVTGLRFMGHEVPLDQRTGLDLTPGRPIHVGPEFELSFDMRIEANREAYFGYIFRAIINGKNYDLIFTQFSTKPENFHLVAGESISKISFHLPLEEVTSDWINVKMKMDLKNQELLLTVGDTVFADRLEVSGKSAELKLFFGAHRYERFSSTDLPCMNIRSIRIKRHHKTLHHWALDQENGEEVIDRVSGNHGVATHPIWIKKLHSTWTLNRSFKMKGKIRHTYDQKTNELIMLANDSLFRYNPGTHQTYVTTTATRCDSSINSRLVIDPKSDQPFVYAVEGNMMVPLLDMESDPAGTCFPPMRAIYWQHNRIIDPASNQLYVFGGYGDYKYFNSLFRYNDSLSTWDTVTYSGTFYPRYLAGLGYHPAKKSAYILGGYGSKTSDQAISPAYYYDLLSYSFEENSFKTIAEFDNLSDDFCFSNSLYIDTASNLLYGLRFSKYEANPKLQAVAISLDDFSMRSVGDPLTFQFLDIKSTIDLFYNNQEQKLISVTSFFDDQNTSLSIHEIAYPPVKPFLANSPHGERSSSFLYLLIILAVLSATAFILRRRKREDRLDEPALSDVEADKNTGESSDSVSTSSPVEKLGSIHIFGGFQVINRSGDDITSSFTPLLKELFLYIMLNSLRFDKGVSSKALDEVFWFDKSEQSARNNRSVNIAKLRSLLETVGPCRITKDTGYWKFEFEHDDHCIDYFEYLMLAMNYKSWSKKDVDRLLTIIQKGPALSNINADWLDDFKAELSNEIIDGILGYVEVNATKEDPDFIIHLANSVFYFDKVNEEAMTIKCKVLASLGKHSLAKDAFTKFEKEYRVLYDENYHKTFNQVLENSHFII
ncbi:MAG: hypothetical protein ABFS10_01180 [Bacteroidota bacterium]